MIDIEDITQPNEDRENRFDAIEEVNEDEEA